MKIKITPLMIAFMIILLYGCATPKTDYMAISNRSLVHNHSRGCGVFNTGSGDFTLLKVHVLDQNRSYHLRIPSTYDPNRAYPLIFRWHGWGGDGLSGGLGIEYFAENNAIVVGADGLNHGWNTDTASVDLRFFDLMLETIENKYCIDRDRVFTMASVWGDILLTCLLVNAEMCCEQAPL